LAATPEEALADAEVVIVSSSDPVTLKALTMADPRVVIDLNGRLGSAVELLRAYEGVSW
jgi:hypothetical protein